MFQNLMIGSALVAMSVMIHTLGLILTAAITPHVARRLGLHVNDVGRTLVMTATVLGILGILTLEIWSWALGYLIVRAVPSLGDALYLSTAMFSTIGYGELVFDPAWRLLTALEGVAGFLLIGWSTAFLVRAATRHGPFRSDLF
jgi:hypothetical protein